MQAEEHIEHAGILLGISAMFLGVMLEAYRCDGLPAFNNMALSRFSLCWGFTMTRGLPQKRW